MSISIVEMQAKRDALVGAITSGMTELTSGDKTIRYQSISQMKEALALLDSEIAAAEALTSTTTRVRQIRLYSTKGM
jgi:hypothetical protein